MAKQAEIRILAEKPMDGRTSLVKKVGSAECRRNRSQKQAHLEAHRLEVEVDEGANGEKHIGNGSASAQNNQGRQDGRSDPGACNYERNDKGDGEQPVRDPEMFGNGYRRIGGEQQIHDEKQDALRQLESVVEGGKSHKSDSRSCNDGYQ